MAVLQRTIAIVGASNDRRKYGNRAVRATMDMFGVRWLLSRPLNYKIRNS